MPLALLEQKLRTLPEQSFSEIEDFFDYIIYKFGVKAQNTHEKPTMSESEARSIFNQFSGSVSREIDYKKERASWRDEKYEYSL